MLFVWFVPWILSNLLFWLNLIRYFQLPFIEKRYISQFFRVLCWTFLMITTFQSQWRDGLSVEILISTRLPLLRPHWAAPRPPAPSGWCLFPPRADVLTLRKINGRQRGGGGPDSTLTAHRRLRLVWKEARGRRGRQRWRCCRCFSTLPSHCSLLRWNTLTLPNPLDLCHISLIPGSLCVGLQQHKNSFT